MPVTVVILMLNSHWSHALRSLLHFNHCSRFLCHAYRALQIHLVIESGILIRFFCVFSRHIEFFGNLQWGKQQCNGYICLLADASPSALRVGHWCLQLEQDFSQVLAAWARLFIGLRQHMLNLYYSHEILFIFFKLSYHSSHFWKWCYKTKTWDVSLEHREGTTFTVTFVISSACLNSILIWIITLNIGLFRQSSIQWEQDTFDYLRHRAIGLFRQSSTQWEQIWKAGDNQHKIHLTKIHLFFFWWR